MPDVVGTAHPPGAQSWRWDWQLHAACRGRSDLFFHPHGEREPARSRRGAAAKALCAGCPVRRERAAHALEAARAPGGNLLEDRARGPEGALQEGHCTDARAVHEDQLLRSVLVQVRAVPGDARPVPPAQGVGSAA